MGDKFLKHFLVIGSGTIINMLLALLTTLVITRIVDPVGYGQYSIFTMYLGIVVMVIGLGLDYSLSRFYYEKNTVEYKRALLFRCVQLPFIFSVGFGIIVIFLSGTGVIKFEFNTLIMACLCICIFAQVIYRFSVLVIRLEYKSKLFSMLKIINRAAYLIIVLPLLWIVDNNDLFIMVIGLTLADLICLVISIFKQAEIWDIKQYKSDECTISQKNLLKYAIPFIPAMGITALFQAIDKIYLNYYCTYTEVGIYSSAMTLIQVFAIIQTTFNTMWAPMQVEHYSKYPDDHTFYQKGNQVITVIMFFIGVSLIFAKDIFSLFLGAKYREVAYILPFLVFNPIMYTISETTIGGLVFKKKSNMQVAVAAGACLTNVIGNSLLVPKLGCQGAAISTGISYVVFFSLRTILANRYYYTDFHLKRFYVLSLIVGVYAFYNTFFEFGIVTVIGYVVCVVTISCLYYDTVKWMHLYVLNIVKELMKGRT